MIAVSLKLLHIQNNEVINEAITLKTLKKFEKSGFKFVS